MNKELEDLEQRVASLVERCRKARQQMRQLESRIEQNDTERERLGHENEQLRARVDELESELASRGSREGVVKNKLQQIVGQIDALEAEIAQIETAGDNESREAH
ncbi:hypothetical protein AMJ85_01135 [candidate division BRC1 bacterium SM23_51]|nr:MAG: hypothetical protein AMJ85_01135 [candidate division BRC1 bacterium SM23_51]